MSKVAYRRKAILGRIHNALDAFYLLQKIDWAYDVRSTIERIIGLAMAEVEFEGGKNIERALIIIQAPHGGDLEVKAGWKIEEPDLLFSRTVVQQTIDQGEAILCENAVDDPRFMEAESIKGLQTLSLISVPLQFEDRVIGAFYIEGRSPGNVFEVEDLEFLREFSDTIAPYLKVALTHQSHVHEIRQLREEVGKRYSLGNIVGRSAAIQNVFELIRIAAGLDRTVLVTGESGTGKELVAKAIHYNGPRREGKFVVVDCSGLSEYLLESELFGHRKGAFTGASHDKVGAFEEASGGTLFLDEISDASKSLQQKLRRVLQEGEIRRVGENELRQVDVRVICATNRNLTKLVDEGNFMRDLYYRINKFPIHIPPLRERKEDIPLLVDHFVRQTEGPGVSPPSAVTAEAMELLARNEWRENNIRELRNVVELAADLARGGVIDQEVLGKVERIQRGESAWKSDSSVTKPDRDTLTTETRSMIEIRADRLGEFLSDHRSREQSGNRRSRSDAPFYQLQLEFSARCIIEGLRQTSWKLRPAARLLGISPTKLRGELKEYVREALLRHHGDLDRVANVLSVPRHVLERKLDDLGLEVPAGLTERSAQTKETDE